MPYAYASAATSAAREQTDVAESGPHFSFREVWIPSRTDVQARIVQ